MIRPPSKVTIGMPVFNDAHFLTAAVESLIAQEFQDFELILADDTSTDGSAEICREFAAIDDRIQYIRHPKNIGIAANMTYLKDRSRSEFFMWAADDDLWDPAFIGTMVDSLQRHPEAIVAFCRSAFIDEMSRPLSEFHSRCNDYSAHSAVRRLVRFGWIADDSFGYGLFRSAEISGMRFPTWWGPNRRTAYNVIFPSLCYALAKGNFVLASTDVLWWNRIKQPKSINHVVPHRGRVARYSASHALRKANMLYWCAAQIVAAGGGAIEVGGFFSTAIPRAIAEVCRHAVQQLRLESEPVKA